MNISFVPSRGSGVGESSHAQCMVQLLSGAGESSDAHTWSSCFLGPNLSTSVTERVPSKTLPVPEG